MLADSLNVEVGSAAFNLSSEFVWHSYSTLFPVSVDVNQLTTTPKNFSKKAFSFSITVSFFFALLLPPNLDTGGSRLSMSVPVVLISPASKESSINLLVSSGFSFSVSMISCNAFSFCSDTYPCHPVITSSTLLSSAINPSISCFLLRRFGAESIAF